MPFFVPTVTLPKFRVAGDMARSPAGTAWLFVPESPALLEFPAPQPSRIAVVKMIKPENNRPCMRAALLKKGMVPERPTIQ
jgi:hypothetical protein